MVRSCCAYQCTSRFDKEKPYIKFHRFPLKNSQLLSKWISAMKRENFIPNSSTVLCNLHFKPENYRLSLVGGKPMLKKDVVPSIFTFSEHLVKHKNQPRKILQRQPLMNSPVNDEMNNSDNVSLITDSLNTKDVAVQTNLTCVKLETTLENLRRDEKVLLMKLRRRNKRAIKLKNAEISMLSHVTRIMEHRRS